MLAAALRFPFVVFFEQLPRTLDAGGDIRQHCLRTDTLRMQERPQGFGEDDLVFKNGALNFINRHLYSPPLSVACSRRDKKSRHRDEAVTASFSLVIRQTSLLPPRPDAIDAAIHIATGVMTHRSARHRTRPQHDACSGNAAPGIANVRAVHDRLGWRWIESDTCKAQQRASSNPGNCR